jgi:uncharacterized protein (AIM24 family)
MSDQNQLEQPTSGAMTRADEGSILDSFESLETEELARYCRSISIDGVIAQSASLELDRGQTLWASKGSLLGYSNGIDWRLKVPGGAGKAVGRMLSGEGVSLTYVEAQKDAASVILGSNQPGQLVTWDLSQGPIVCTSGSFVAALGDVDIDVQVARKAGAAFFGGAGLFMQKLSGDGIAVLHGSGDFIERRLDPGESILVSTGNLAVFSGGVDYDIKRTGGCLKSIFGGEGIFMTELTGPGWVMLQSLKKLPAQGAQQGGG